MFPSPTASLLLLGFSYLAYHLFWLPYCSTSSRWLSGLPWVGVKGVFFPRSRGRVAAWKRTRTLLNEGHAKFSQYGRIFVLPSIPEHLVVLNAAQIDELARMGDDRVVSELALDATFGDKIETYGPHMDIVRGQLTRNLSLVAAAVSYELERALQSIWPVSSEEWASYKLLSSCNQIVSRASSCALGCKELAQIPQFLEHSQDFSTALGAAGFLMGKLPLWLRSLLAPLILFKANRAFAACLNITSPIIRKRLASIQHGKTDDPAYEKPQDFLQWLLEATHADPSQVDEARVTGRLLVLNTVALQTTTLVVANVILDLYSSPRSGEWVAELRAECERVLAEHGGVWTKDAVNSLHRIDSTIKESMRFSDGLDANVRRRVVDPNGIKLSDGTWIAPGVMVATPACCIHRDAQDYPNPDVFDPFRFFSQGRQSSSAGGGRTEQNSVTALVATTKSFVAFGHGKHACPGRFFAAFEMKLMLARIVMDHDVRVKEVERPKYVYMNGFRAPSEEIEVLVRLRR
ncbi:hypothetical protein BST61_g8697 [Cercospora zeina]